MLTLIKSIRFSDLPALILRTMALGMIGVHLFIAMFVVVQYNWVFYLTVLVFSLLLAREMYEDLARRYFKLKAEEAAHHTAPQAGTAGVGPVIEAMRVIDPDERAEPAQARH